MPNKRILNKKKVNKKTSTDSLTKADLIKYVMVPVVIALISTLVAGYYQLKSINKANEGQLAAAVRTSDAQIEAAKITKVKERSYDFKESNNWNVKESREYMPLKKGNYWFYKGSYLSYSVKNKKSITKKVTVKFEIQKEIVQGAIGLFIVSNYPVDIYQECQNKFDSMSLKELNSPQPIEFIHREKKAGLLLVANKLFYIPSNNLEKLERYVKNPNKPFNNKFSFPALSYEDLMFEFPMYKGQRFGDLNSITRDDLSYFWYVNSVRQINTLKGETFEETKIFDLLYNTVPDQRKIVFRPYLGIIQYSVIHNGTPDDLQLDLDKFKIE